MSIMGIVWLCVLVIMIVLEGVTAQLVSVWFVAGALAAWVTSMFVANVAVQCTVFIIVSLVLLLVTRPFVRKLKESAKFVPTNADRFIGETAVVLEDIDETKGVGQVKVCGSIWSAKTSKPAGEVIRKGSEVIVKGIAGVKLVVEPKF